MSFIKWVGGKQQLLTKIETYFPEIIETYYEPFIGGGSVLLFLLEKCEKNEIKINNFVIGDVNRELIDLYKTIKNQSEELITMVNMLQTKLKNLPEVETTAREKIIPANDINHIKHRKEYYYYIRNQYNIIKLIPDLELSKIILKSAYFIFLNKVGFRGLYRENTNGEFNVPYGNYKNPILIKDDYLRKISIWFNKYNIDFRNSTFSELIDFNALNADDFIYLDPPYYPIDINSFTSYSSGNFNDKNHKELFDFINKIDTIGECKFLMSNSYTPWIIEQTKLNNDFNYTMVLCSRRINSKKPESQVNEILVWNYEILFVL